MQEGIVPNTSGLGWVGMQEEQGPWSLDDQAVEGQLEQAGRVGHRLGGAWAGLSHMHWPRIVRLALSLPWELKSCM